MSERLQKVEARAQEADGREMSRATEVGECLEFLPALSFLLSVQEERGTWAKRTISFALPFVHSPFCHFPSLRPPPILLDAGVSGSRLGPWEEEAVRLESMSHE